MKQGLTMERFTAILKAYGSEPSRWPEEERDAAMQFISENPHSTSLQATAAELDQLLDSVEISAPSNRLYGSILSLVAKTSQTEVIDRLLDWLFPTSSQSLLWLWRPVIAVTLPLAVGFILGAGTVTSASVDEWDTWEEEIYVSGIVAVDSLLTTSELGTSGELDP